MILSDVLRHPVLDASGAEVGRIIDARFVLDGRSNPPRARLVGFIVSPRSASSYLGYERGGMSKPAILSAFLRWRHRGSFLVAWESIAGIYEDRVVLRAAFEKQDASLPEA